MQILLIKIDAVWHRVAQRIVLFGMCIFSSGLLLAQDDETIHEATTAVSVLRISPDARSAGMGETSIATLPGAASGMLNAAKSVFVNRQSGVVLNYAPWLRDISSDSYIISAGGYFQLDDKQALTSSLRYFSSGKVEDRDYNNNLVQLVIPTEFTFDAGYSRKLSEEFSVGLTFRYINSSIGKTVSNASGAAHAFAADISAFFNHRDENGKGLTAGLIIANLGTGKISYGEGDNNDGFLPARAGVGVGYTLPLQNDDIISISGDFNKSLVPLMPLGDSGYNKFNQYTVFESYGKGLSNGALSFSIGAEYLYRQLLAVRGGYFRESKEYGGRKYFSVGAGVFFRSAGLDLAYIVPSGNGIDRNALSNTLRLGLTFSFTGNKNISE